MQSEPQPPAPAVVVVVVTCDPGPWFGETLACLAAQDYPNLAVLVIDAGSTLDPTEMVAKDLPGAYVRRKGVKVGFGRAANDVLAVVEGASHYLFCHDDVALAPDAVRLLVEEAFRSNSGITTPKYVQWEHPDRLVAVGATADKVGVVREMVEPGELDQQQHDVVREVLMAPSGATLVRADLFHALGGFSDTIDQFGEDLDLSWRARVAGARVTAVPAARVRHLQAIERGIRRGWEAPAARRRMAFSSEAHRIRTVVTCYRWFDLAWILPLAFVWSLGEAVTRLFQGRPGQAWATMTSFLAGFGQPAKLWRDRRRLQRGRLTGDHEIRRLQARGNARLRAFLSVRVDDVFEGAQQSGLPFRYRPLDQDDSDEFGTAPVDTSAQEKSGRSDLWGWRGAGLVGIAIAVVLLIGSRNLIGHELPAVNQIPNTSEGWHAIWRSWWSAWQQNGLGSAGPSSPALSFLGLIGTVLFGAVGTLQHVVVLGPLVIGPFGAYRAARWWGSRRGRIAAMIAYAVVPLQYNDLARGRWAGLVAYAAAPWLLSYLARLSAEVPFPSTTRGQIAARVAGLAVIVAVVAAVAISFLYVVLIVGMALLVGSALAGRVESGLRMLAVAVAATVGAFVLLLPWSGSVLGSRAVVLGPSSGPSGRLGLGEIMRFHTGPFGSGVWGWALLVVAALPLLIGSGWRLAWAARLWLVALACFFVAWAGLRGWVPALPAEVVLAPAAAALAGSAALGAAAFELDLPGYRFGWRQVAATVAGLALAVAVIPWMVGSSGGRWHLPSADASSVLSFLPDSQNGDYRVLWVGAPEALPLASRHLERGMAYGTSFDGEPGLADIWLPGSPGATGVLAADLHLVEGRLTTKIGHLLAPTGVRYLVIPNHNGPSGSGAIAVAQPSALISGLALQTDLQLVDVGDPNYTVYDNSAWAPARAVLSPAAVAAAGSTATRPLQQLDLSTSQPVLTGRTPYPQGSVPAGSTVYVASTRSGAWRLRAGSASVTPQPAFGWAMSFAVPGTGAASVTASLGYRAPFWTRAGQILVIALWVAVLLWICLDLRRRRNRDIDSEVVDPAWFTKVKPRPARPRRTRARSGAVGSVERESDEVWTDA
jgi:GT2 family glycosyltransferase